MKPLTIRLEPWQHQGLRARADARGTDLARELCTAVDAYLTGLTVGELDVVDAMTSLAKAHLDAMVVALDALGGRIDAALEEMDRIRESRPVFRPPGTAPHAE
jgi:hypothetical protein